MCLVLSPSPDPDEDKCHSLTSETFQPFPRAEICRTPLPILFTGTLFDHNLYTECVGAQYKCILGTNQHTAEVSSSLEIPSFRRKIFHIAMKPRLMFTYIVNKNVGPGSFCGAIRKLTCPLLTGTFTLLLISF